MTLESLALLVESITGVGPLQDTRKRTVVESRCLLVSALLKQGYTEEEVAALIGFDHSTVHHYRDMMRDAQQYNTRPGMLSYWKTLSSVLDL